jgi:PD-(D/E)XK nuclease superfamily
MIPFDNTFEYPVLEKQSTDSGRIYLAPNNEKLPSVTNILGKTKDMTQIHAWRKRAGVSKANQILKEASGIGTAVHNNLERWILGEDLKFGSNIVHQMAKNMVNTIIENGLSKVTKVYGIEKSLYYPGLFAGTVDLVGEYQGKICIIDYKNSLKIKKEEYLEDYYCQIVAYSMAHNKMFGTDIDQGVVMMVARPKDQWDTEPEYKEFILEGDKFQKYTGIWLDKLDTYYAKHHF